jgi:methionine sulfoxide reductase catalytic subunit
VAPRVRIGRSKWFNLLWLIPIGFVLLIAAVAIAKGLLNDPAVQRFIARYPGVTSGKAAIGMPAWVEVG